MDGESPDNTKSKWGEATGVDPDCWSLGTYVSEKTLTMLKLIRVCALEKSAKNAESSKI